MSNFKDRNILKKSASTNKIGVLNLLNLSLREAKSYAGAMAESKCYDPLATQRRQNNEEACLELFSKDHDIASDKNSIATKDSCTQEVFYVNEELLSYKGTTYTTNDIAWSWKKDCRMWLWKNNEDFKKNRSVAEFKTKT